MKTHPILFLSLRSLRRHKKQFFVQSVAVILCIALVFLAVCFISGFYRNQQELVLSAYGAQDAILFHAVQGAEKELMQKGFIKELGSVRCEAFAETETVFEPVIAVGVMDQTAIELGRVKAEEGRLPLAENEAAVCRSTLANLNSALKLGDVFELETVDISGVREKKSYVLVGILNDYLQQEDASRNNIYKLLPRVLRGGTNFAGGVEHMLVKTAAGTDIELELYNVNQGLWESQALRVQRGSGKAPLDLSKVIVQVAMVLFVVMGVCVVLSVFLLCGKSQRRQIANLRIAGAGNKETILYLFIQHLCIVLVSVPIGVLAGRLLLPLLWNPVGSLLELGAYRSGAGQWIALAAAIAALLLVLFYSLLVMLRRNALELKKEQPRRGRSAKRLRSKSIPFILTYRNTLSNRNGIFAILTCALCIAVFLTGVFLQACAEKEYEVNLEADYTVVQPNISSNGEMLIPGSDLFCGLSHAELEKIRDSAEVQSVSASVRFPVKLLCGSENDQIGNIIGENFLAWRTQEEAENIKNRYGYGADTTLYSTILYAAESSDLARLEQYVAYGTLDLERLHRGEACVLILREEDQSTELPLGAQLSFSQILEEAGDFKRVDFTAQLDAVIVLPQSLPAELKIFNKRCIWFDVSALEELAISIPYTRVLIDLKDKEQYKGVEAILNLIYRDPSRTLHMESKRGQAQVQYRMKTVISTAFHTLSVLLMVFAVIHLVNYMYTKLVSQRGTLDILSALGMTRKQAAGSFLCEYLFMLLSAFLCGTVLTAVLCSLIGASGSVLWQSVLPLQEAALILAALVLASLVCALVSVLRFGRRDQQQGVIRE